MLDDVTKEMKFDGLGVSPKFKCRDPRNSSPCIIRNEVGKIIIGICKLWPPSLILLPINGIFATTNPP